MEIKNLKFEKNELLTFEELKDYISEEIEISRARLIASKIKDVIILQNETIVMYNRKTRLYVIYPSKTKYTDSLKHY